MTHHNRMQCSAETYHHTLSDALQNTRGTDDGSWNKGFQASLIQRGLWLTTQPPARNTDLYPNGMPYLAPRCYGAKSGWPQITYVVWMTDASRASPPTWVTVTRIGCAALLLAAVITHLWLRSPLF